MQVMLDIFSGKPNPNWEITSDEEAYLHTLLLKLQPKSSADFSNMNLGYRGFILSSIQDRICVFYDTVVGIKFYQEICLNDPDRTLENYLIDVVSPKYIDEELVKEVKQRLSTIYI